MLSLIFRILEKKKNVLNCVELKEAITTIVIYTMIFALLVRKGYEEIEERL